MLHADKIQSGGNQHKCHICKCELQKQSAAVGCFHGNIAVEVRVA